MQLDLPGRPHLTYCTNIHAGEHWEEISGALRSHVLAVKEQVAPDESMGVGLRLSGLAAERLAEPQVLDELKTFLAASGLYVFTINAFPYGPFHGVRVKEDVYQPDWRDPERLRFTNRVADILSELLPDDTTGSISTVPGAFKAGITGRHDVVRMAAAMVDHAAHLYELERVTGKEIVLALEPEPCCFLETTNEAIAFFEEYLFARDAVDRFSSATGTSITDAAAAIRRHLGLCFDVCHAAVVFEDVHTSLASINGAGIRLPKIQLSSALKLAPVTDGAEALLRRFDDGVYLHQTYEVQDGNMTSYPDLPAAFAALHRGESGGEWRVHCHVPLFEPSYGPLQSTRDVLSEVLGLCRTQRLAPHLEVETYTWGVLPEDLRTDDIDGDIARELTWVRSQLEA